MNNGYPQQPGQYPQQGQYPQGYVQQQPQGQGFGFNVNDYEANQAFENLPPAWYNAQATDAKIEDAQSGNGNKRFVIEWTIYGGPFAGRKVFEGMNIIHTNEQTQEIARRDLRALQDAIGKALNGPQDVFNAYACIKVGMSKPKKDATEQEKASFEPRNTLRGYKPFDAALDQQMQQTQGYNVQVTPQGPNMGNGMPGGYAPQSQPPMPQHMQQMPNQPMQQMPQHAPMQQPMQQQPMQQMPPQQQMPQQMPGQQQPQQQYNPQQQPGQNFPQAGSMPQGAGNLDQQGQQQNAPGAMAPAGQYSPQTAGAPADSQGAPQGSSGQAPQNFAPPQNGMPGAPGQPPSPPQQQMPGQMPGQPPMAQPNQQFAPQGQPPQPQQQQPTQAAGNNGGW